MILKLERQHMKNIINRWKCIPYVSAWKWDQRELSVDEIEGDNYYDIVCYDPDSYKDFSNDMKMAFTWIEVTVKNAGETNTLHIITTLMAFMLNDEGKTIEKLS